MAADTLRAFLDDLGLGAYHDALAAEQIEPADIALLSDSDLAGLGLPLGPRRRLLKAAQTRAPTKVGSGERRNLTVLFCDMVGSTAIATRLDPEDLRAIFRAYREACVAAIEAEGGYIAHSMGDGMMAYFGFPRAQEDAAIRAVRAGLALVDDVGRIRVAGETLEARVGVASGLTVVEDALSETVARDEMATGSTLALAARLQALAPPGEVVVSDSTRLLLRGAVALEPMGEERLKGFSEPEPVWRATGEARPPSRFDAAHEPGVDAMIGREAEREALLSAWRAAAAMSGGGVVLVGEPGIGKSRLLAELRAAAVAEGDVAMLQCSPYRQGVALHPVVDWLAETIGRADDADAETRRSRLAAVPGLAEAALPELAGVMGLAPDEAAPQADPMARQAVILDAVTALLAHAAPGRPRLVIVEDAHWADAGTLDVLDRLATRAADAPLLLAATARPFAARLPEGPGVRRIDLERLPPGSTEALIARQPGASALAAPLRRTIAERSGGVPLFVEELTRAMIETPDADPALVPMTLQDTLMARLDRLRVGKPVAQLAALVGRSFSGALLEACADIPEPRLRAGLAELVSAGLVAREADPEPAYAFRHALMRDAAYGSMLRSRRIELHRRVAETLELRFPALAESQPDIVAHHFTEAGDVAAAVPRWAKAAERAIANAAPASAIRHFTTALDLLMRRPESPERDEREMALRIRLNMPLTVTTGFASSETETNLGRIEELFKARAPSEAVLQLLWSRAMSALVRADLVAARSTAQRLSYAAERAVASEVWRMPARILGYVAMLEGELDAAQGHFDRMLDGYAPEGFDPILTGHPFDVLAASHAQRAIVMALKGWPEAVARDEARALERARRLDSPATAFQVLVHLCLARFELGDHEGVRPLLRKLRAVVDENEVRPLYANLWEAWEEAREGALEDGVSRMRAVQEEGTQYPLWMPSALMLRAGLLMDAGRHADALETLAICQADIQRLRHTYLLPEHARRRALCLAATGGPEAQVVALLEEAVATAAGQGSRRFELSARRDLARRRLAAEDAEAAAEALRPGLGVEPACHALPEYGEIRALLESLPATAQRLAASGERR